MLTVLIVFLSARAPYVAVVLLTGTAPGHRSQVRACPDPPALVEAPVLDA